MEHQLPELPYEKDALAPHISQETLEYHYGKHHATYVANINKLVQGGEFENASLEEIIKNAPAGGVFNNAAQAWNHTFYWFCLSPKGGGEPRGDIASAIDRSFGSFEEFKNQFTQSATTLFGAGWTWLVRKADGNLAIENRSNAGNPLTDDWTPLLTCDMWEHAYYIDYRNAKAQYMDAFWSLVNWDFVEKNLQET